MPASPLPPRTATDTRHARHAPGAAGANRAPLPMPRAPPVVRPFRHVWAVARLRALAWGLSRSTGAPRSPRELVLARLPPPAQAQARYPTLAPALARLVAPRSRACPTVRGARSHVVSCRPTFRRITRHMQPSVLLPIPFL